MNTNQPFTLGDWQVYPDRLLLVSGDQEHRLEPKAMQTLLLLANHAGETVSRETLIAEVWKDTYGTDELLSRIVSVLRNQLGDDSKSPLYIETVPRIGYRLIISPGVLQETGSVAPRFSQRRNVIALIAMFIIAAMLTWLNWPAESPSRVTIAVLPFEDVSYNESAAFLAPSLMDEIKLALGSSPDLRLVTRRSIDDPGIARDSAMYLVGRITHTENLVRVIAELSNSNDGELIWSRAFEFPHTDYLRIQKTVSAAIRDAISDTLGRPLSTDPQQSIPIEAYTHFLNGQFLLNLRGETALHAAIEAYNHALEIDPAYDRARLGLATAYVLLPYYSDRTESESFRTATQVLEQLNDRTGPEAQAIMGFMSFRTWQWQAAEHYFLQSIADRPENANVLVWYSQFLSAVNRKDEALEWALKAYDFDSASPVVNDRLATAHLWLDHNEQAATFYERGTRLGFAHSVNPGRLNLLIRMGEFAEAQSILRTLHPTGHLEDFISQIDQIAEPDNRNALIAGARQAVESGSLQPRFELGLWMLLGDWDAVTYTFEKYRDQQKYLDIEFLFARESMEFRTSETFYTLTGRIGLMDYWSSYSAGKN